MRQTPEVSSDPRNIARNLSGIFDAAFPQLAPAIVAHFNRTCNRTIPSASMIENETLAKSTLQRSMLFELAIVVAEERLAHGTKVDWKKCLEKSVARQKRYFDANIPETLREIDREIADVVATNLLYGLTDISRSEGFPIVIEPKIPGFRWISSGIGDFASGKALIEVKCSNKRFSTADYRQIVIYWLLKQIESLQSGRECWKRGVLINPRLNRFVEFSFKELIDVIAPEQSYSSIVTAFCSMVRDRPERDDRDFEVELRSWPKR